jgi:hypothetical protein
MFEQLRDAHYLIGHLLIIAAVTMLMAPLFRYVLLGWHAKKKDIMDGLDTSALHAYFEMFTRAPRPAPQDEIKAFNTMYRSWYGQRFFILPGIILFVIGLLAVALVVLTGLDEVGYITNTMPNLPATAVAALAGAYLWVVHDLILRSRRLDLSPADVLWCCLRLIIAVPMGYAFASILNDSVAPFVAFSLGAFPLSALLSISRRIGEQKLGLAASPEESSDDIVKLQGINPMIVERLRNEDVSTVTQIAYCDPVRLVMRSNLTFNFVTDCMNQALAWMYVEEKLDLLRPLGLRGAVEIKNFIDAYDDVDPLPGNKVDHDAAVAALPKVAEAIGQSPETLEVCFREIAGDPYAAFLSRVWTCVPLEPQEPPPPALKLAATAP